MAGEMIEFRANGGTANGYLAKPTSGSGPGVIVVQEWWGLVDHIKDIANRLASEGYVALAPDLYHGSMTTEPQEAQKLLMEMNLDQAASDLRGAAEALKANGATGDKVGAVGFCMGGLLALYAGSVSPNVGAVVDFYGVGRAQPDFSKLQGSVLLVGGDQDQGASPQKLREAADAIKAAGQQAEVVIYPGAQHAFMNDTRKEVYKADAAQDAWGRMLNHLRTNVK